MSIFRRSNENKEEEAPNELMDDMVNINFAPLWEDEEPSGLLTMIMPIATIILLIIIVAKVW